MVTIHIDGTPHTVPAGRNLLQTCLGLGLDLPYFCWHPALGSVGACRQCAVKRFRDENDRQGEIVMACMTPVEDGMRIAIGDPEAVQFRACIIEWLMINHPHDCPVCDEGGECHLQDMTVLTGHNRRRYRFPKRTHRNQDLGPFLHHEMNRCIQCYRCVRFYRDYAGGTDFNVFSSRDRVYFGRFQDGPLESEFSGNLVEICPTGVFTDKPFRSHVRRKWDLQSAPSVCVHCGLGCNTIAAEREGRLRRIRNRRHHQINGYFLCDRGRFGYAFVNGPRRTRQPLSRPSGSEIPAPTTAAEALDRAAAMLTEAKGVIGIGSPRASLEDNFALRTLVGAGHFFAGLSRADAACIDTTLDALRNGPAPAPPIQELGLADAALILGEDVTQTAPIAALNLRRMRYRSAARHASGFGLPEWNDAGVREVARLRPPHLFSATPFPTRLDDEARRPLHASPRDLVRFAYAVLAALAPGFFPAPGEDADLADRAREIARTLLAARRPAVVTGISCGFPPLIEAAANVAWCLRRQGRPATFTVCVPECNSLGLGLMAGGGLAGAFRALRERTADTLIILENDLYRRADAGAVDDLLRAARNVIVIDHQETATTRRAGLVLPSATFAEATGTRVNSEGRAQRGYSVMPPAAPVQSAWRWLHKLMTAAALPQARPWKCLQDLTEDLAGAMPLFQPVAELDPEVPMPTLGGRIPRQSHRYSGRTAMHAHLDVSEPKPPEDEDAPLAFTMEGYDGPQPPGLTLRVLSPGWHSEQALNKFHAETGPPRAGDGGRRLIEPATADSGRYFDMPQAPDGPGEDEYLLVAMPRIFGSEELSMNAPAVSERAPAPYLAFSPESAPKAEGEPVRLVSDDASLELPVRILPGLPRRTAAFPVGLPGLPFIETPAHVRIVPSEKGGRP